MAETADVALLDGETGDTSQFTSLTQEGSNTFTASSDAEAHGTYGFKCTFSGNAGENLCSGLKTFTARTEVYARAYVYVPADFSGTASSLIMFGIYSGSDHRAYLRIPDQTTMAVDRIFYWTDAGTAFASLTGVTISKGAWHYIEYRFKAATAAGANDGITQCWLDGASIYSKTDIDSDTLTADRIQAGQLGAAVPDANDYIYIDDIKINSTACGAYSDASAVSIPVMMHHQMMIQGEL